MTYQNTYDSVNRLTGKTSALNFNYQYNGANQRTRATLVDGSYWLYVDVMGLTLATNTVSVNGQAAYQKWDYFREQLAVNNSAGALWTNITVTAPGQATNSGHVYVGAAGENFTYDLDGNLTRDGRWTNSWDAENRLVGMTALTSTPVASQYSLSFTYDYMGRRIQKTVSTNSGTGYVAQYVNRFVYEGWNLAGILDGGNNLLYSFTWGTDLSGNMQGAGGVGGAISMTVYSGTNAGTYFYCYDGNGNVVALVSATNGTIAAQYEYGPFGEVIRATGPMAKVNPFMFSTKFYDWESGVYYYGARYYNPSTGRWLSRDPLGEQGGLNLYMFVHNHPTFAVDGLGLEQTGTVLRNCVKFRVEAEVDYMEGLGLKLKGSVFGRRCTCCDGSGKFIEYGLDTELFVGVGVGVSVTLPIIGQQGGYISGPGATFKGTPLSFVKECGKNDYTVHWEYSVGGRIGLEGSLGTGVLTTGVRINGAADWDLGLEYNLTSQLAKMDVFARMHAYASVEGTIFGVGLNWEFLNRDWQASKGLTLNIPQ